MLRSMEEEYRVELCGPCIHRYDNSLTYRVTELGPRRKCTCAECGNRAYGAFCKIEQKIPRQRRIEPHEALDHNAR